MRNDTYHLAAVRLMLAAVMLVGLRIACAAASSGNPYDIEVVRGAGTGPTLHIAPNGSDSASGTVDAPLKTLTAAIARVKPGGTIVMRGGTYQGAVVNQGYGTANAWVTLRSAQGETVILQGNPRGTAYPTLYFYHSSCDEYAPAGSVCQSAYWRVEGLRILGAVSGGADSNAVKIDTQHVQIANSVLCCAVPDVVKIVRTANDAAILDNEIFSDAAIVPPGSNSQGVDITGADRVRVIGNHFHDLPDVAAYAKANARNPIFANNRIHNTGFGALDSYNAIMLGQQTDEHRLVDGPYESYDGLVVNNIVSQVAGACFAASSSLNARFAHNTCIDTALRSQAGMLISTEGGLGYTPNKGVEMVNNIFVQSTQRPRMLKSTDREYTRPTEAPLKITNNIYWARGAAPTFIWIPDFYNERDFSAWQVSYQKRYGATDASRIVDPRLGADHQPAADSPAAGKALPGYALYDHRGRPRSASAPTVGALEVGSNTSPAQQADLTIVAMTARARVIAGGKIELTADVANGGGAGAVPSQVAFLLSTDTALGGDRSLPLTCTVPALAAGALFRCFGEATLPANLAAGTYHVVAVADARANVEESNEANNTRFSTPIVVEAAAADLPDIRISMAKAGAVAVVGRRVVTDVIVTNDGKVAARAHQIGIYLSTDNRIDRTDRKLAQCTVAGIRPGGEYRCSIDPIVPSGVAAGTYRVGFIADELNAVAEGNEGNNARAAQTATRIIVR